MATETDITFEMEDIESGALNFDDGLSTPSDYERPITKSSSLREMTMSLICEFLDVTDVTMRKWVRSENCPYLQAADKKTGKTWLFDSAAVVRWYAERTAKLAVERVGVTEDGVISADEAKRRRLVALAISSEIDTGEKLKEFVRVPVALRRIQDDYAKIRTALQAIPNAVAGQLAPSVRDQVKSKITEAISEALSSLKVDDHTAFDGDDRTSGDE